MKKLIMASIALLLVFAVTPAIAGDKSAPRVEPVAFQALSNLSASGQMALSTMTDEQLAAVEGQSRWRQQKHRVKPGKHKDHQQRGKPGKHHKHRNDQGRPVFSVNINIVSIQQINICIASVCQQMNVAFVNLN